MSKTKPSDTRLVLYGAAALASIALAIRFLYALFLPSGTWMRFVLWANEQPESIAWWHHVIAVIVGAHYVYRVRDDVRHRIIAGRSAPSLFDAP